MTGANGTNGTNGTNGADGATGPTGLDGALNAWSLTGNAGTAPPGNFIGTTDANHWQIRTNNIDRVRVTSTGNVGINTLTPAYKLDVNGYLRVNSTSFPGRDYRIECSSRQNIYAANDLVTYINGNAEFRVGVSGGGSQDFYITNGAGTKFFTAEGNDQQVGIGTISPLEKLHVVGNIRTSSLAGVGTRMVQATAVGNLTPLAAGAVTDVLLGTGVWGPVPTNTAWSLTGNAGIAAANFIGPTNSADFKIRTNNIERMTVEANGNVGIGLVTPLNKLHVSGTVANDAIAFVNQTNTTGGSHAVQGQGVFGPTRGYLGVQGAATFDGIAGLNIAGNEIGVIGISTGGSATDNFGVLGFSNGDGVGGFASTATGFGVYANNSNATGTGLLAAGNNLGGTFLVGGSGVAGTGTTTGVYGTATAAGGTGVYGSVNLADGFGVFGNNDNASGTGVIGGGNNVISSFLVGGSGGAFTGTETGIAAWAQTVASGTGVAGAGNNLGITTLIPGSGVAGSGVTAGVYGISNSAAGAGVLGQNSSTGWTGDFQGPMRAGNATANRHDFWGWWQTGTTSDNHRVQSNGGNWGYVGDATFYWWRMYSNRFFGKSTTITLFDTYDDLALLNAIEADTVWDPVLQHHIMIIKPESLPRCVLNYGELAAGNTTNEFVDLQSMDGLLIGSARQLDRETKARDKRLVARTDILADALGLDFGGQNQESITKNIYEFGTASMESDEVWVVFPEKFSSQLGNAPVVTISSNSPDVVLYVSDKNTKGFKVVNTFGKMDITFDWSAFAKVEIVIADKDVDHLDDVFYRKPFELPRGDYKEFVPYIGESKDDIRSYDPSKYYPEDMESIIKTNNERKPELKPTESIKRESKELKKDNEAWKAIPLTKPKAEEEKQNDQTKSQNNKDPIPAQLKK